MLGIVSEVEVIAIHKANKAKPIKTVYRGVLEKI